MLDYTFPKIVFGLVPVIRNKLLIYSIFSMNLQHLYKFNIWLEFDLPNSELKVENKLSWIWYFSIWKVVMDIRYLVPTYISLYYVGKYYSVCMYLQTLLHLHRYIVCITMGMYVHSICILNSISIFTSLSLKQHNCLLGKMQRINQIGYFLYLPFLFCPPLTITWKKPKDVTKSLESGKIWDKIV